MPSHAASPCPSPSSDSFGCCRHGAPRAIASPLPPGEHSSSEHERRTGITKAGPMELRRTLIQTAEVDASPGSRFSHGR